MLKMWNGVSMSIVIRKSRIHSHGCYTTAPIREGALVIEYVGERMTPDQADDLYDDHPQTYLFGLDGGKHVLDGYGVAAFINHSCDPNCETDEIQSRVWIIAARDIEAGEELTYDYNLYDGDFDAPCTCGARNCRGTMYDPDARKKTSAETRKSQHRRTG